MARSRGWSTRDIGDLSGKVAIVTGANAGLGYDTTVELIRHGAHCVLASRNPERAIRSHTHRWSASVAPPRSR